MTQRRDSSPSRGAGVALRRRAGVAAALAALGILTSVGVAPGRPAATVRGGMPGAAYVALGDSYSAGEGLGPFEKGTDVDKGAKRNQCHRSRRDAYAVLSPAVVLKGVRDRAFFACSGATSDDMRSVPPQTGSDRQVGQPQQTATVGSGTRYISLSAGGNDVGFGDLGIGCVEAVVNHRKVVRFGSTSCGDQIRASQGRLAATRTKLAALYGELLDRAPNATIAVLGYPRVLPDSYKGVPKLAGGPFCVLDHYPIPLSTTDIGLPVPDAKKLDDFTVSLNRTIKDAVTDVRKARPAQESQLRFAASYGGSVPHNCKGTTKGATVTAAQLTLGRGLSGEKFADKLKKLWIGSSTLHPTKAGQKFFATVVQRAFDTLPAPLSTEVVRQAPVTPDAAIAPGFAVTSTVTGGQCLEGSDIGTAYRCFSGNGVYDPCYAVAEPGTGDGTSVVCLLSPFTTDLTAITGATGLGRLDDVASDEPDGLVLASGAKCTAAQGSHDSDSAGHVVDFYCDDHRTAVLRGLHQGTPWTADIVHYDTHFHYTKPSRTTLRKVVLLLHDNPPANRPVTDAQDATAEDLDASGRVHHEVDCGADKSTASGQIIEQTFTSGIPCYTATLIVVEWDNGQSLEPGWTCTTTDLSTLLCQKADAVATDTPPAFFAATHLRAQRR